MTSLLLRLLPGLVRLWKPLAAFFGAAFLYLAGRSGAAKSHKIKDLQSEVKAHEIRNEVENRIARERDVHDSLRDDWQR